MQKRTMLCLLLTMTLVVAVKAQVNVDCLDMFTEAAEALASTDQACSTTLRQVTSESTECNDDVKKAIDECFDKHEALWTSFKEACETVTTQSEPVTPSPPSNETNPTTSPSPSPSDVPPASPTVQSNESFAEAPAPVPEPLIEPPVEPASVPAPEPEVSGGDWPMWQPAMTPDSDSPIEEFEDYPAMEPSSSPASIPEDWSPEPSEEAEEPVEEEISIAPEPSSARRLSRRLLSEALEEEEESDFVQLKRTLLQSANPTCRDLFIRGGADAFHNNAASVKLSLLSIIGSILLGLMLI